MFKIQFIKCLNPTAMFKICEFPKMYYKIETLFNNPIKIGTYKQLS